MARHETPSTARAAPWMPPGTRAAVRTPGREKEVEEIRGFISTIVPDVDAEPGVQAQSASPAARAE